MNENYMKIGTAEEQQIAKLLFPAQCTLVLPAAQSYKQVS